jgi:hypothetical protein
MRTQLRTHGATASESIGFVARRARHRLIPPPPKFVNRRSSGSDGAVTGSGWLLLSVATDCASWELTVNQVPRARRRGRQGSISGSCTRLADRVHSALERPDQNALAVAPTLLHSLKYNLAATPVMVDAGPWWRAF